MPKTLNIAVIGAGTMAQAVHLPVLRRRWDRFAVTALVDHSARRRRESSEVWGVAEDRRYESVSDLITAVREKTVAVDAALLSTDGLHVEDLLQLMRRGIPVLVEPPLGFSAEEVAKVADFECMTGRSLVMMAYPQQYDESVAALSDRIATKDVRMIDHEVLMPASQPLFGGAHVTTSAYDLPTEVRSQRRKALQAAVVAGSGEAATQRDRDLYVKGLLTGVAHQLSVIERAYGSLGNVVAVRHWPKGVIPGSIEILAELEGGAPVRVVWHYLPFAPEYSERIQVLSARRRVRVELPAPSLGDRRSSISLREKVHGVISETETSASLGAAESMWEAFHEFVVRGTAPVTGAARSRQQVELMREVLAAIVASNGRSLDQDPDAVADPDPDAVAEPDAAADAEAVTDPGAEADVVPTSGADQEPTTAPGQQAPAPDEVPAPGPEQASVLAAPETLQEPEPVAEPARDLDASPVPEPGAEEPAAHEPAVVEQPAESDTTEPPTRVRPLPPVDAADAWNLEDTGGRSEDSPR